MSGEEISVICSGENLPITELKMEKVCLPSCYDKPLENVMRKGNEQLREGNEQLIREGL